MRITYLFTSIFISLCCVWLGCVSPSEEEAGAAPTAEALAEETPVEAEPVPDATARQAEQVATFSAVGQEPGWMLDLTPDGAVFEAEYGTEVYEFADYKASSLPDGSRVYTLTNDEVSVTVTVSPENCQDAMSGQNYSNTVVVRYGGETLRGCGGSEI